MFGLRIQSVRRFAVPVAAVITGAVMVAVAGSLATSSRPIETLKPTEEGPQVIDVAEREYLWEIEHHGNVLAKSGFKVFARALANADRAALLGMLAPDFAGGDLGNPKEIRHSDKAVQVVRRQDAGNPANPVSADEFVDLLLRHRRTFYQTPKVELKYATLSPEQYGNMDGVWGGRGLLTMRGESAAGQPAEVEVRMNYRLERPTTETLARGGWLHGWTVTQTQEGRASRYLMREVARERGIDASGFYDRWTSPEGNVASSGGAYLCDFNRDGYIDILVTDYRKKLMLFRGGPDGKFVDVAKEMGLPLDWIYTAVGAIADLDGDGWEDIILGRRIFRNVEGKRFEEVTNQCNLRLPLRYNGIAFADYDRDGLIDLYVTVDSQPIKGSWVDGKCGAGARNYLFHNRGNWQFEDVTASSGTDGDNRSTFAAAWFDANDDGWPDLFVPNEFGNGVLLINQKNGKFSPQPLGDGPTDFGTMGVVAGDIDNDGHIDLYLANMYSKAGTRIIGNLKPDAYPPDVMSKLHRLVAGSQLHRNRGDLKFDQLGKSMQVDAVGWAYGPGLIDLDNDGFLDIFAPCGYFSENRDKPDG